MLLMGYRSGSAAPSAFLPPAHLVQPHPVLEPAQGCAPPGRAEVGAYQDLRAPHYRRAPYQPLSSDTWPPLASLGPIAGERGSLAEASNRERFEQESIASHMMAVGQRAPYPSHRLLAYHAPAVRATSAGASLRSWAKVRASS